MQVILGLVFGFLVGVAVTYAILRSPKASENVAEPSEPELVPDLVTQDATASDEVTVAPVIFSELDAAIFARKQAAAIIEEATLTAQEKSRTILIDVMQRSAMDVATEVTTAVVPLPSEDVKGRIIGRDGRNIRTFEQITGVDLIVDESPDAVVLSSFDPIRRETARLTLMNLVVDGRIHPARIEELHAKSTIEIQRVIQESGVKAAERAKVSGLNRKVIDALGQLKFRSSYAQNVLEHSIEVSLIAGAIAYELKIPGEQIKRAALLHDIGKGLGLEWEGAHAISGMNFLKQNGEKEPILNAVGAHHRDIEPVGIEAELVIIADTISASRPGARRESLELHLKRLASLEAIANGFEGVESSYAVQAGREIRIIVKPDLISDEAARSLAVQVALKIEENLDLPGTVKVTVIRELRASATTKRSS